MSERIPSLNVRFYDESNLSFSDDQYDFIESDDASIVIWFEAGEMRPEILRLFAAAPDLLTACEIALETGGSEEGGWTSDVEPLLIAALNKAKPAQ